MIDEFIEHLRTGGKSESTQRGYSTVLKKFFKFAKIKPKTIEDIDVKQVSAFLKILVDEDKSAHTKNMYLNAIRSFFRYYDRPLTPKEAPYTKTPKSKDKSLTIDEVREMMNTAENIREKAIIATLFCSGLRISDFCNLKISNLDLPRGLKGVNIQKTRDTLDIRFIHPELVKDVLTRYLRIREHKRPLEPDEPLFVNRRGKHISMQCTRDDIIKIGEIALKKRVTPHAFRHSHVVACKKLGISPQVVAVQIGDTVETVQKTYSHYQKDDVDRELDEVENGKKAEAIQKRPIVINGNNGEMSVCPRCDYAKIYPHYLQCPICEEQLKDICEICGALVELEWNICPECGAQTRQGDIRQAEHDARIDELEARDTLKTPHKRGDTHE